MKKNIFKALLITLTLCCNLSFSQEEKWAFIGIRVDEDAGCINNPYTKYDTRWILKDSNFNKNIDSLRKVYKDANPGRNVSVDYYMASQTNRRVMAVVEKRKECGGSKNPKKIVLSYGFYAAADEESLKKNIDSDLKFYSEVKEHKIVKLFHSDLIIPGLELAWDKDHINDGYKKETIEKNYEGVIVKFTVITAPDGRKNVLLAAHNSLKDKKVKLIFLVPTAKKDSEIPLKQSFKTVEIEIEPDDVRKRSIPIGTILEEIQTKPFSKDESFSLIEWTKKKVKDVIIDEKGKIQKKDSLNNGGPGKRG